MCWNRWTKEGEGGGVVDGATTQLGERSDSEVITDYDSSRPTNQRATCRGRVVLGNSRSYVTPSGGVNKLAGVAETDLYN